MRTRWATRRLLGAAPRGRGECDRASSTRQPERFASLPSQWRTADFDFDAQPSVDKETVNELATLRFLEDATNVFMDLPGVGKTMLAVDLARASIDAGYRTNYTTAANLVARCHLAVLEERWATTMRFFAGSRLLVIDEVNYLPLANEAAASLFQVITNLYLKSSTVSTTNLGIPSGERFSTIHGPRGHAGPLPAPLLGVQDRRRQLSHGDPLGPLGEPPQG